MKCLSHPINQKNNINTNLAIENLAIKKLKESISKTRHIIIENADVPQGIIINDELMEWCSVPHLKSELPSHKQFAPLSF